MVAFENRSSGHEARAVEEDVDLADLGGQLVDCSFIGGIQHFGADALLALQIGEQLRVQVGRPDLRTLARERERRGAPDALAGCGDERGLACESACHGLRSPA